MNFSMPAPTTPYGIAFPCASPPPLGFLPTQLFQSVVQEAINVKQVPPPLAYICALGAIATAVQGKYDIEMPHGMSSPLALQLIGVGGPGTGKSTAGRHFFGPLEEFEMEQESRFGRGVLIYKDTNAAALYDGLQAFPSAVLASYEGNEILNGIVRANAAKLNALWSGEQVKIQRKTVKSFTLNNARLTTLILVQPHQLQAFLSHSGEEARGIGFLARLIAANAGDVSHGRVLLEQPPPTPYHARYRGRIRELLLDCVEFIEAGERERERVRFSSSAGREWLRYANAIEIDKNPGRRFAYAPDHAGRLGENIARIAGLLHTFEGYEGEIAEETLAAAITICETSSQSFMTTFVREIADQLDANVLDQWLTDHLRPRTRFYPRAHLRRYGPNRMRDYGVLQPLIDSLESQNRVAQVRRNGTIWLDLFPNIPPSTMAV